MALVLNKRLVGHVGYHFKIIRIVFHSHEHELCYCNSESQWGRLMEEQMLTQRTALLNAHNRFVIKQLI